jgi:hypothetical protein
MSVLEWYEGVRTTALGKGAIIVIAVAALGAAIFGFNKAASMNSGQSRYVSPQEFQKGAQAQADAINKMTNLTPQQKQAMLAHFQGEASQAGQGAAAKPGPPQGAR